MKTIPANSELVVYYLPETSEESYYMPAVHYLRHALYRRTLEGECKDFFNSFLRINFLRKKKMYIYVYFFASLFWPTVFNQIADFFDFFYSYFKTRYVEYVVAQIVKNSVKCDK